MTTPLPAPPAEPRLLAELPHGPVLAFVPHPDDEIAGPGGALCLHRRAGDPVRVVVATDGIAGDPDARFEPQTYAELRRSESRRGLRELGVDDVEFWGFPDNCVLADSDIERGVRRALATLQSVRPRVVYLPWEHEGHPDHHALHHIVVRALSRHAFDGIAYGYEIWNAMLPDLVLDVTSTIEQKRRAMRAYESQLAYVSYDHCVEGLNAYRSLVHGRGKGFWEAYRIVRVPTTA